MEKRIFSDIKAQPSLLGFGCMRLPLADPGKQAIDFAAAQIMVDRAIEMGVNYFDTAWPYHQGLSESFIGQALAKYPRDSYYLASKMPTWDIVKTLDDAEEIFAAQLEKCRVEYFDFYLLHSLDSETFARAEQIGLYDFLKAKKDAGKIRRLGFSFHDCPPVLEQIVGAHEWDFAQIQLNYLDWDVLDAKRQYEILTENHLPVIIMEPVRGGTLASLNDRAAALLKKADPEASLASWAIRYAASLPNVMTVLSGMSTLEQLEDNLKTLNDFQPLTDSERETLMEAASIFRSSGTIPCTGCRYCMDCPSGVNIPSVFAIYNLYRANGNRFTFDGNYFSLPETAQAHHCTACGVCLSRCPQSIDIPEEMTLIAAAAAGGETK